MERQMAVTRINPPSLHTSPYYSQGMLVDSGKTLYIGGQNGTDAEGAINGGIAAQSEQAARNVLAVVEAAGGSLSDIVKLTIIMVDGQDFHAAYDAGMTVFGGLNCAVGGFRVAGLARPEALIEIEGIAHIP
jgi:2-iminobutanoate/2-iminopropanoate deaminase